MERHREGEHQDDDFRSLVKPAFVDDEHVDDDRDEADNIEARHNELDQAQIHFPLFL